MNDDELQRLNDIKIIFKDFFADMPEIEIYESQHYYMTVDWTFILTFDNEKNFVLMFNDDINPLLSARIAQLLAENNIKYEMRNNYYYSPYTKELYFEDEIEKAKNRDRQKSILQPTATKMRH
jgi:hypothetical protein